MIGLISCVKSVDVFCCLEVRAVLLLHTDLNKAIPESATHISFLINQSVS
ncbi:hypothetical protein M595_3889 [Lyngbya aestuarii BL J]|uniref:Uncharacterized protein n=1 Tax=Lyngbya aestuarii BL J TaxID=1348334 RepID=U7QFV1_9CYAN|nr:hypothetical protein M595_3889 [Lyngbya aestuarii BL J]